MKKVVLFLMLLAAFAAGAEAHSGSVGLYSTMLADDCDLDVNPFVQTPIYVFYFRSDSGPDGIFGAEFKLEISDPMVTIQSFTPPASSLTIGPILEGIGITFTDGCRGAGTSYVYLGTITIFVVNVYDWTMHIVPNPTVEPPGYIYVMRCDALKTLAPVLGGWFHEGEGACSLPVGSSSWGAIKSIYNE